MSEGGESDCDGAAHHEGERRIPPAAEIEEPEHFRRIGHSRQTKAKSEQEADKDRRGAAHAALLQNT